MVASPNPLPIDPQPSAVKGSATEVQQITESLVQRILKSGPPWVRYTALLLAALAPYARYPVNYLQGRAAERRIVEGNPYSAGNAVADLNKTDPTTRVQLKRQNDDNKHIVWHQNVKNESPQLVTIYNSNEKGLLAYKVFDSDGCLLVERARGSAFSPPLLIRGLSGAASDLSNPSRLDQIPLLPRESLGNWDAGVQPPAPSHGARLIRVQTGCLTPHPGQFRFWYGTPADQCWVPMYRQFTDGCTHYQMFNRCNNTFNPEIHWTQCVPRHSW